MMHPRLAQLCDVALVCSFAFVTAANLRDCPLTREMAQADQVRRCESNLRVLGEAVRRYHADHGSFPRPLSKLYPDYLTSAAVLLCPAAESRIKAGVSRVAYGVDTGHGRAPCAYTWCCLAPNYPAIAAERGEEVPWIICMQHASLILDETAGQVRSGRETSRDPRYDAPVLVYRASGRTDRLPFKGLLDRELREALLY